MTMSGNQHSFSTIYKKQLEYQGKLSGITKPEDDVNWFLYHIASMSEEIGELVKADKRWKTHRNAHFDFKNKVEELADVFITAFNLAIYSGVDDEALYNMIISKIAENSNKLEGMVTNDRNC